MDFHEVIAIGQMLLLYVTLIIAFALPLVPVVYLVHLVRDHLRRNRAVMQKPRRTRS